MSVLSHLEPQKVFSFFEALCAIPHGSGNTAQISDYCANFAKERGLEPLAMLIFEQQTPGALADLAAPYVDEAK